MFFSFFKTVQSDSNVPIFFLEMKFIIFENVGWLLFNDILTHVG